VTDADTGRPWGGTVDRESPSPDKREADDISTPHPCLKSAGRTWQLSQRTSIGRRDDEVGIHPDIDLTDLDPELSVSRRHAAVELDHNIYWIQDLGSANGTIVNDRVVEPGQRRPLRDGARIRLGDIQLRYRDFQYAQSGLASRPPAERQREFNRDHSTAEVFISYAQDEDGAPALALREALEREGVSVWIADDRIQGGQNYGPAVVDAIQTCKVVIVLISESSMRSPYVAREVQMAFEMDRCLLPLRLEGTPVSDTVLFWLGGANWIDIMGQMESWLPKVVNTLISMGVAVASRENSDQDIAAMSDLPRPS
jgi:TIR domain/FHA domain